MPAAARCQRSQTDPWTRSRDSRSVGWPPGPEDVLCMKDFLKGRQAMLNAATEEQLLKALHEILMERIPFNRVLGIDVVSLNQDCPELRFKMRPDLVGNFSRNMLHGGVISAVHDLTGGVVAFLGVQQKLKDRPIVERIERFGRIATIDLRVDYLRPGLGAWVS